AAAGPIGTHGGMVPVALAAATDLILEGEIFCEVVPLSRLLPLDVEPVLASVSRTGALVTIEEGTLTGGIGAELAPVFQEQGWGERRRPVRGVASRDGVIPSARGLEDAVLPGVRDVVEAVLALQGHAVQ